LTPVAKQLFIEVLSRVGARLGDADGWTASVKRTALVLEGKLSPDGLSQLFSLIQPPAPAVVRDEPATPPAPKPTPAGSPSTDKPPTAAASKAAISKEYFATVDGILDRLAKNIGTGAKNVGLADGAAWLQRDARRISRLPIKDVDPDLVKWGANTATRLRDAAQPLVSGTLQSGARAAGATATYSSSYSNGYEDYSNMNEMSRVEGQRRQMSLEERAKALEGASGTIRDIMNSRDDIRAEMVKRYGVEF
jgi:hypothetical protein